MVGNNRAIPDPNSTDIGFLQDMHSHHEQAVLVGLSFLELDGASRPLRDLARETASHHEAGTQISQYAAEHANVIEVKRFASELVDVQESEIDAMRELVAG